MQDKPTNELDEMLCNLKPEEIENYLKENRDYMADEKKAFYYYYKDTIMDKNKLLKEVYIAADFSESYGSQLVRMEKHTKNRDNILKLCIAGHFLLDEINRALKLYGMTPLYSKDKRDACIIVCINNRKYDIAEINEILERQGFAKFSDAE